MATVDTIAGPLSTSMLGQTLMHEHVFIISNTEMQLNYPELWDEEERVADAIERLKELKAVGFDTIVDLTVIGLGRSIPRIKTIAAASGMQIIVATGLYAYNDMPMFFKFRGPGTWQGGPELLTEMFVKDIEQGIGETGIKAGVLKCVTDTHGVTGDVERVLRATAAAHRQTGVPISTHTDAHSRCGLDQQRVFKAEGVDLTRVIIGHCGDSTDLAYLREIADAGSYLGMDRFGLTGPGLPGFDERVDTVAEMCRLGYAGRMVLSHDTLCYTDCFDKSESPDWKYTHLAEAVLPALAQRGASQHDIDQMLVVNPREIFERKGGY